MIKSPQADTVKGGVSCGYGNNKILKFNKDYSEMVNKTKIRFIH